MKSEKKKIETFYDKLRGHAENLKDKVFIKDFERKKEICLTFGDFKDFVDRISNYLLHVGVQKGDRVGVLLVNSYEFFVSLIAIQRLGAIPVPINTFLKADEIKFIIENSNIKTLITQLKFRQIVIKTAKETNLENIICKETINRAFNSLEVHSFKEALRGEPLIDIDIDIFEDDTAIILYTSGTTGKPKGVMLTYKNLISNVKSIIKALNFTQEDKFLVFLPMFHTFMITAELLTPLYLGASIVLLKSVKPFSKVIKTVEKEKITVFMGVPEIYGVLNKLNLPKNWGSSVRYFISGGAPLPLKILEEFNKNFNTRIYEGYGLTETSPTVSVNTEENYKVGSVGKPIEGVEVKIFDENFNEVGTGKIGEVAVKGDNVMKGYFNNEEATKKVLKDGWLLTGDYGYLDEEGFLHIVGRKKDLIISKGINIYPREVEEVILQHPLVEECAVVGKQTETNGEIPVAFIKLKENRKIYEKELKLFLRDKLAFYKIPKYFYFVDFLPKNPSGKILKRKLRELLNKDELEKIVSK